NHGGRTHLGPRANPLARVTTGVGNDGVTEGAWQGSVFGTYCHGPALARNPALADLLLRRATGLDRLAELDETWVERLRRERLAAARSEGAGGRFGRPARRAVASRGGGGAAGTRSSPAA